jgi:hypothetical protein
MFKPGDRVRAVRKSEESLIWDIGSTGTVDSTDSSGVLVLVDYPRHFDGSSTRQWLAIEDIELIKGAPTPNASDADVVWRVDPVETDNVYQPNHYARYVIEPITFINANKLPFNIGNVIKYACRYDAKNGVEDLRKAIRYLEIQIECLERGKRVDDGQDPTEVWKDKL